MITKLWAINVLHASQVEGKALAFLPFYKNAIRRILPSKSSARRFCGPENGSAILADSKRSLRALRHTQYPPLVEANVLASAQPCLLMLRHGPENGKAILAVPKVVYPLLRSMNFTVHSLNVQWNSVFLIYSFPLLRLLFWLCWRYLGRGSRLCLRGAGGGRRSWFGLRLRGLL